MSTESGQLTTGKIFFPVIISPHPPPPIFHCPVSVCAHMSVMVYWLDMVCSSLPGLGSHKLSRFLYNLHLLYSRTSVNSYIYSRFLKSGQKLAMVILLNLLPLQQ